jgi:hypothetical protein
LKKYSLPYKYEKQPKVVYRQIVIRIWANSVAVFNFYLKTPIPGKSVKYVIVDGFPALRIT